MYLPGVGGKDGQWSNPTSPSLCNLLDSNVLTYFVTLLSIFPVIYRVWDKGLGK